MSGDGPSYGEVLWQERDSAGQAWNKPCSSSPAWSGILGTTHNKLQAIVEAMVKLGGIYVKRYAVNFLLDKVGNLYIKYITRYVNHVTSHPSARRAPFVIVPDLHTRNYPRGR